MKELIGVSFVVNKYSVKKLHNSIEKSMLVGLHLEVVETKKELRSIEMVESYGNGGTIQEGSPLVRWYHTYLVPGLARKAARRRCYGMVGMVVPPPIPYTIPLYIHTYCTPRTSCLYPKL